MEIGFDLRGNLKPYTKIEMGLVEFERRFVLNIKESENRKLIFEEYSKYVFDLAELIGKPVIQWVDGSFLSKKINPRDIDVLTFIENDLYSQHQAKIDERFGKWHVKNFYENVDAYTIRTYPEEHKKFPVFQFERSYWTEMFSHTRVNRANKRFQKGFIEIKII